MSTLVCTAIMVADTAAAFRDAELARGLGADLVEYRIDDLFSGAADESANAAETSAVLDLVARSPLTCIVTCRTLAEGGHYDGPEDARISLFERLGTAFGEGEVPPRYLDVELSTWQKSANIRQKVKLAVDHPEQVRDTPTSLILSTHDFKGRPADLSRRLLAMQDSPAKVLKVAYLARSLRDNLELFDILTARDRPTIALAMGEPGLMSRVLAPKFGGFLTFASLRPATTTAPGQPTIADLFNLYRFRTIGPDTAVYGVVGFPVGHSLSPHLHNAGFESIGHDGVYIPMPVAEGAESLKATLLELLDFSALTLRGLSITAPHKQSLVELARAQGWSIEPAAEAISAANTLTIRDGSVTISNTDAPALVGSLAAVTGPLAGKAIAVIGAGGVARAAVYGLAHAGATVTVFNRSPSRAEALIADLTFRGVPHLTAAPMSDLGTSRFDALINCTPAGMAGGPAAGESPAPLAEIARASPGLIVADTVYTPVRTPLLKEADALGSRTVPGRSMFIAQAAAQFSGWTGKPAPAALFDRIARERLASV
jgi:3-dehydroquinate dehydratase / shikimate dehydrogenase